MWLIYTHGSAKGQFGQELVIPSILNVVTVTKDAVKWATAQLPDVKRKYPNDDWQVYTPQPKNYDGQTFYLVTSRTKHINEALPRIAYYCKWVPEA